MNQVKWSRISLCPALLSLLLAAALIGCTVDDETPTWTISGTVTISGNLVSSPAATSETIRFGVDTSLVDLVTLDLAKIDHMSAASIFDGTATYDYTIAGVPEGWYYFACSIDVDGDGAIDSGDYAFIFGDLNPGVPSDPSDDPPPNIEFFEGEGDIGWSFPLFKL